MDITQNVSAPDTPPSTAEVVLDPQSIQSLGERWPPVGVKEALCLARSLGVNLGKDNLALFMRGSGVETVNISGYDMAIFPRK